MKRILTVLLGIVMISTLSSFISLLFGDSRTPSTKMAHKITKEIGCKLKSNYGLNCMGISEEGPDGKYKKIGIIMNYPKVLSKDEGRVLLLNCLNEALKAFNSYPNFKQYMANVPFTGKNIMIKIYIEPPKQRDVYFPDIGVLSLYNDTLWYKTYTAEMDYEKFIEDEETYEEAMKIVEAQQKGELPFNKS